MHKIGIISDTHGVLRPEVTDALKGCELILHGGDINKQKVLDELEQIAPKRHLRYVGEHLFKLFKRHFAAFVQNFGYFFYSLTLHFLLSPV